jgi:anti-sigma-K factor RskA
MSANHLSNPASNCDAIRELIPDYAFGLTDSKESRLVETNLAYCPEAADQLADFRRIQAEMRTGVPQIEPPPQLIERLMAAIDVPVQAKQQLRPHIHRLWWAVAAAVIALIVTNVYWLTQVSDLTQRQKELSAQIAQPNAFVLASTANLRWVRLPPSQQNTDASAFMMWNAESEIGLLYARGFPTLEAGKTYQLWLTRGDEKVSAGTFRVDADGQGALLFHVTEPIDKYTWARITAEPENGSDAPNGNIIVVGKLST